MTKQKKRDQKLDAKLKININESKTRIDKIAPIKKEGIAGLDNALSINIDLIIPNPNQPRKHFNKKTLEELAESIKERGVLQAIRVRLKNDKYEIIAGERRWQASNLAGLKTMPCVVCEQDDKTSYIDALMENIQREDLNPIDRANALTELRVNLGLHSWDEVGKKLGLTRQHIYNLLGLKSLPEKVQIDIKKGALTEKHGRALKTLLQDKQKFDKAYQKIKKEKMSGDETLDFIKSLKPSQVPENQKTFVALKTNNQKYQDLLQLTDFEKFDIRQKETLKKTLLKTQDIISRAIKKI